MTLFSLKTALLWLALFTAGTCVAASVRIVNTAPSLINVIDTHKMPDAAADALAEVLSQHAGIYRELFGIADIRTLCGEYVRSVDSQRAGLTRLSDVERLNAALNASVTSFTAGFPKFDSTELSIVLLPSFGRFQAQARTFRGKPMLLFDSAFFSTAMSGAVSTAFVHHELFHIYHGQINPDVRRGVEDLFRIGQMPSLGTLLWAEGMAVHCARRLNPDVDDAELFPSATIVASTERDYVRLLKEAADGADNATMPGISGFFYIPRLDGQAIPQNCGYVIGERVVDQILKEQSLDQIMLLSGPELTSAVRRAATQIAGSLESPSKAPESTR